MRQAAASAREVARIQKQHAKEIASRLNGKLAPGPSSGTKPLETNDQTLLEALKRISHEFDLPMALDAKAMRTNALREDAKVRGALVGGNLKEGLSGMLAPLGLAVEIRHEVALVTPKPK